MTPGGETEMEMINMGTREVRSDSAVAYYNGYSWSDQIDIVANAVALSGLSLEWTAPSVLRTWDWSEDRRCE